MVHLNRIRTGTGDGGETSLGDGTRVPKWHPRVIAQGGVDELNAALGIVLSGTLPETVRRQLGEIQNHLCDIGADLCQPQRDDDTENHAACRALRVTPDHVDRLNRAIDAATAILPPLRSFVLPGGSSSAAFLHHARTICRRVEIDIHRLAAEEPINSLIAAYLNRLSDLLFVLARRCNDGGAADVLWQPGVISSHPPSESSHEAL